MSMTVSVNRSGKVLWDLNYVPQFFAALLPVKNHRLDYAIRSGTFCRTFNIFICKKGHPNLHSFDEIIEKSIDKIFSK